MYVAQASHELMNREHIPVSQRETLLSQRSETGKTGVAHPLPFASLHPSLQTVVKQRLGDPAQNRAQSLI